MDKKTKLYVKEIEGRLVEMARELHQAQSTINGLEAQLDEIENLTSETQQAHRSDIGEISQYQRENSRLVETLQIIADGKGKYAKIARDAIS